MAKPIEKLMSVPEAVRQFVKDGDHLIIGNYTVCTCMELVFEILRQGKKGFTLYSQSGILDVEMLVAGGAVERLVTTYVLRSGGRRGGSAVERALQAGSLQIEDYTNFNYNARLMAGMHGFSFMQVFEGITVTDLFKKRGFLGEDKYRIIQCPYTGKEVVTVPAANPDVCILHVQRADKFGNAQYWGAIGSVPAAALASKRIIVTCEQIVDTEIIRSSPHHTIIPAFRTDAVIEVPWGAHPTEVVGHYNQDRLMYGLFMLAAADGDRLQEWMDEWIFRCHDRPAYIDHYADKFGSDRLQKLVAKPFYSAPADYGSAFHTAWDENGQDRATGMTMAEIEGLLDEKGLLYD
ncbi:3-oxoadipate CoA-transferase subunit A (EC [Olavius algarvensis Delta 1 endosymbiont]|nr:3-oxoadipate CoA-transferase subunit A (EC [Olavius algarvensis Delta 1 endosymbiont]